MVVAVTEGGGTGREFPDRPLVGVGAIVVDGGRVLLILRDREPLAGYWSLPGGLVELGETLRQAAQREVREETGVAVDAGEVVEVFERIERDSRGSVRYHYVLVDFLAAPNSGDALPPQASSDARQAAWFGWDEIARLKLTPGLADVLEKARPRANAAGEGQGKRRAGDEASKGEEEGGRKERGAR